MKLRQFFELGTQRASLVDIDTYKIIQNKTYNIFNKTRPIVLLISKGFENFGDMMLFNFPDQAFDRLVHMLNKKNIDKILSFSCLVSMIDYYDLTEYRGNLFAPLLNVESINLLGHALIDSKAADYKKEDMKGNDIKIFYGTWLGVIGFRQIYVDGFSRKEEGFNRQALTFFSAQMRFQSYFINYRLSRAYGLLVSIPEEYKAILKKKENNNIDIPLAFEKNYGISIMDFLRIGLSIIGYYFSLFNTILPEEKRKEIREYFSANTRTSLDKDNIKDKLVVLTKLYEKVQQNKSLFIMEDNLGDGTISKDTITRYLELTSKSIREIKMVKEENQAYQTGIVLDRLSPLERYPIIKTEKHGYIVPNFRYFEIAITELLHYLMQDIYPDNSYNQSRGFIQEIYIKRLIEEIYNPELIIPETRYKKAKGHVLGPDLCLCDGKMIVIESKAKRLNATSRVDPTDLMFIQEISAIIDALIKLTEKVQDLYSSLPEYKNYHELIASTKSITPIALIIMGEAIPLLPEIFQDHIIRNNITSLNNYPYPYMIVDLNLFEKILVIVNSTGEPLYDVLLKYSLGKEIKEIKGIQSEIDEEFRKLNPRVNLPILNEWEGKIITKPT